MDFLPVVDVNISLKAVRVIAKSTSNVGWAAILYFDSIVERSNLTVVSCTLLASGSGPSTAAFVLLSKSAPLNNSALSVCRSQLSATYTLRALPGSSR